MKGITDGIFLLNFLSFKAPEISENSEHKQQCWNYKVLVISFRSESRHLGNFQHHSYLHESIFFYISSFCYFRIDTSICWRVFILTTSTITPKSKQGDTVTTSTTTKAKKKETPGLKSCSKFQSNIKNSLYLAGKYVDICPRISSVARCKQFSESEADNVRAQISIHIFAQIEAIMFIFLQIFCNAREKCVRTAYCICSGDVFFWVLSGTTLWTKKDFPSSVTIPNPLSSWIKFDTKTFPCGRKV